MTIDDVLNVQLLVGTARTGRRQSAQQPPLAVYRKQQTGDITGGAPIIAIHSCNRNVLKLIHCKHKIMVVVASEAIYMRWGQFLGCVPTSYDGPISLGGGTWFTCRFLRNITNVSIVI